MKPAKGLIVCGINNSVGSTTLTAALAAIASGSGLKTGVMLPIETGVSQPQQLGPSARLLQWAAQSTLDDKQLSPWRLTGDCDPLPAAAQESVKIDFNALLETAHSTLASHQFTLIDAGGGLMQPLAGGLVLADFAAMLKLPLLFVTDVSRGAIAQMLMTLFCANQFDLEVAGYIINRMPLLPTAAQKTLPHDLATMTAAELLAVLPEISGEPQQQVSELASALEKMPTYNFMAPFLPEEMQRPRRS